MAKAPLTRLAPSPTGALHLGNARSFLINWAMARRNGWGIVLRIEDLDTPRVKAGADLQAIEDLRWLGVDWDEGPYWQKRDLGPYTRAMESLRARGLVYACRCTRREIDAAASAPHAEDHEQRYPGHCRDLGLPLDASSALRLRTPPGVVEFEDALAGPQRVDVQAGVGDFVLWTKAGLPAYQLAVVVDDARQGVTQVVRGDDLLGSTGRQVWLYRLLELGQSPGYTHLPLVLGPDGRRLAKRHGDTRLASLRAAGVAAEAVVGLLAWWSGLVDRPEAMDSGGFLERFDLARVPRSPVTCDAAAMDELLSLSARACG
jgi:glutamyl-tRNA synthetase